MTAAALLAVDLGTSSIKVVAFGRSGGCRFATRDPGRFDGLRIEDGNALTGVGCSSPDFARPFRLTSRCGASRPSDCPTFPVRQRDTAAVKERNRCRSFSSTDRKTA